MQTEQIVDVLALARVTIWAHTLKQTVVMARLEATIRALGAEPEPLDPDGVVNDVTGDIAA